MSAGDPRAPSEPDLPAGDLPDAGSVVDAASASARRIILARAVSLALIFVGSIILSRTLGPDGRGAHAFYVALTILAATVLGLSAPGGGYILAVRHGVPAPDLAANAMWFSALSGLLAAAGTVVLQVVFGFLPSQLADIAAWPVLVAVGVAGFSANLHQLQLAFARGRSIAGAVLSFGPYTVAAIGYLLLPVTGGGLAAALWIFALAPYVLAVAAAFVRPPLSVVAFGRARPGLARRSVREGLRMYPGEFAGMLHQRADVLLLGILAPTASLGVYVVAYQTVEPILVLASASAATVLALGHGHPEVERGMVTARLIRETLLSGGLLALLAAVLAPILVPLDLRARFRGLGDATADPAARHRGPVLRPDRDVRPHAAQPPGTDGRHLGGGDDPQRLAQPGPDPGIRCGRRGDRLARLVFGHGGPGHLDRPAGQRVHRPRTAPRVDRLRRPGPGLDTALAQRAGAPATFVNGANSKIRIVGPGRPGPGSTR